MTSPPWGITPTPPFTYGVWNKSLLLESPEDGSGGTVFSYDLARPPDLGRAFGHELAHDGLQSAFGEEMTQFKGSTSEFDL